MRRGSTIFAWLAISGLVAVPDSLTAQTGAPPPATAPAPDIEHLEGTYDATLRVNPATCATQRVGGSSRGEFRVQAGRRELIIHLQDLLSLFAEPVAVNVNGTSFEYSGPIRIRVGPVTDAVNGRLQGQVTGNRQFDATYEVKSMICSVRGTISGRWSGPATFADPAPLPQPTVDYSGAQANALPPPAPPSSDGPFASLVGQEVSLQASNYTDRFIRHRFALGYADRLTDDGSRNDAAFRIVPGLAGSCISLESRNLPNHFLRHQDWRIRLAGREDNPTYRQDATFCLVPGLAGGAGVSLESVNFKGHFIRHRNNELWVDRFDGSDLNRKDATFVITQPGGGLELR